MGGWNTSRATVGTTVSVITNINNLNQGMQVKALATNAGRIFVHSADTLNSVNEGYELSAGDEIFIPTPPGSRSLVIFAIASQALQGLCILEL